MLMRNEKDASTDANVKLGKNVHEHQKTEEQ